MYHLAFRFLGWRFFLISRFMGYQITANRAIKTAAIKPNMTPIGPSPRPGPTYATPASGIKNMGMVMGAASKKAAGRADNQVISKIVKELLA